ncbi:hypothetical protein [Streptomyces sp. WMMB303]|uniref:hypothetical protein n=1 Tax=Streptomyces sp. WMMB303 TaxID=3034154 RepID=UPI0023ED6586|nr:hypothetical protein [Streptomyces sp. WMMB303]MDF4252652.1 hypothetical protein [Streptomyces sp. WMMB303]
MGSEPDADRGIRRTGPCALETLVAVRGCLPLAAVGIGVRGTVVHWGSGASALFGHRRKDVLGAPAADILPVTGALNASARAGDHHWLDGAGDLTGSGAAMAGRARVRVPGRGRADVLWWSYPLAAPAPVRLLVLATGTARLQRQRALRGARVVPSFGHHRWFPEATELGARLPRLLGRPARAAAAPAASRIRELGCPVVEVHRPASPDDPTLAAWNAQVSGRCGEDPRLPG